MVAGGRRAWPALAAALAALSLLVGPALMAAAASQGTTSTPTASDAEAGFVSRVAAERRAQGRGTLTVVEELAAVGRRHSAAMASENRVYHNPYLAEQVQDWEVVGENVGAGYSVDDVHNALMSSSRHRDVILDPRVTEIGVGVVVSNGKLWVTEVFRQPTAGTRQASAEPAAPTSSPSPTAEPTSPPWTEAEPVPDATDPSPGPEPAAAPLPAPRVGGTTFVRTPAPPSAPRPTTPTTAGITAPAPAPHVPGPDVPAELAIEPLPVAASAPLPLRPELPAAGVLAAFLLWSVVAGLTNVVARLQPRRAL